MTLVNNDQRAQVGTPEDVKKCFESWPPQATDCLNSRVKSSEQP